MARIRTDAVLDMLQEIASLRANAKSGVGLSLRKYENLWEGIASECDAMSGDDYYALTGLLLATGDLTDKDIELIEAICTISSTRYNNMRLVNEVAADARCYRENRIEDIERKYRESVRELCCVHLGIRKENSDASKRRTNP